MTSEWDPVLSPDLTSYLDMRINDSRLEIKLKDCCVLLDQRVIPQMIKILQRMDRRV